MHRARIIIKGDVQMVGFRGFVIEQMKSLNLKGYADNLSDGTVEILCEGERGRIEDMIENIKETQPHFATVESVKEEWQEYIGNLKEPERRGEDVPKEATLDDVVKVLTKMDMKLEIGNERLGSIDKKQDQTINEIKTVGNKVDSVGNKVDSVGNKVDALREETRQDFNRMDTKYDKVSEKMDSIDKTLKELTKAILLLVKSKSKDLLRKS